MLVRSTILDGVSILPTLFKNTGDLCMYMSCILGNSDIKPAHVRIILLAR